MRNEAAKARVIAHVDMDAFFVSVERLDDPSLASRPVIVGNPGGRSVVLSASYELRALGVHSAQAMAQAMRIAPHAVVVPPHHERYSLLSRRVMEVLRDVTPAVEQVSVDEAYLDLSGALRSEGPPERIAAGIRSRLRESVGLPASVGLAPNKFLAKMASGRAKPDGVFSVPPPRVREFLDPLPVERLFGVGAATARALRLAGYATAGDLAAADPAEVGAVLGKGAERLAALAAGRDEREVVTERDEKSLGAEHTFEADVSDPELLDRALLRLAHRVAARARAARRAGEVVAIKVRWDDFTTLSRQLHLQRPSDAAAEIHAAARSLLAAIPPPRPPVRLLGVRLEGLAPADAGRQLSFEAGADARRDAEAVMDRINARFGGAVAPAALMDGGRDRGGRGGRQAGLPCASSGTDRPDYDQDSPRT